MTKKHILLVPAFVLTFVFCSVAGTAAFQCSGHYISAGSFRDEVLELCGEPSLSDTWQEERLVDPYILYNGQWVGLRRIFVTIDRWTYNFGPTHHMQTLTFENAKLISIRSGRNGY